ncbi:hypothetical protein PSP6_320039 [Paraburkholderia tropica]|nr:hypothetical protein PSP6_320039 [Paraburkholderia tropica]
MGDRWVMRQVVSSIACSQSMVPLFQPDSFDSIGQAFRFTPRRDARKRRYRRQSFTVSPDLIWVDSNRRKEARVGQFRPVMSIESVTFDGPYCIREPSFAVSLTAAEVPGLRFTRATQAQTSAWTARSARR